MPEHPTEGPNDVLDSSKPVRGVPPKPQTDAGADAERKDIERRVFAERTRKDKTAEEALSRHKGPGDKDG